VTDCCATNMKDYTILHFSILEPEYEIQRVDRLAMINKYI